MVHVDLIRWITIPRLISNHNDDLILGVQQRSGGSDWMVRAGGGADAGDRAPAAAPRGASRRWSLPVFQGSKPSGLGSGRIYASCVIHPWPLLGSGRLRDEDAMAAEVLRGRPRRRAAFRRLGQALSYGN